MFIYAHFTKDRTKGGAQRDREHIAFVGRGHWDGDPEDAVCL